MQVKAAGVLCRASKNDCDLPEHCTGLSAECPEDVFQENGISCHNGNGYCYNGACPSHGEQCRALWGAGTSSPPSSPHVLGDVLQPRLTRPSLGCGPLLYPSAVAAGADAQHRCELWLRVTLSMRPTEAQVAPDVCFKHNSEQHLHLHCLTEYGKRPCSPK